LYGLTEKESQIVKETIKFFLGVRKS
jgi:hypothetical protein